MKMRIKTLTELIHEYGSEPFYGKVPTFEQDVKNNPNLIVDVTIKGHDYIITHPKLTGAYWNRSEPSHTWPVPKNTCYKFFTEDVVINFLPEELFEL